MKHPNTICPITYEIIEANQKYSRAGLKKLSPKLSDLQDLPLSAESQRIEARLRADKMSIQGVQPKLSATLNIKNQGFELCDSGGLYILKPQSEYYKEVPENEDLSMHLAALLGIEVPLHGLIYSRDGSLTYFIKRFDRLPRKQKIAVEDFSQLAGLRRDTKYNFSMEKLISIIEQYCTFPMVEKKALFIRTLFNFVIGNEDMHVKNYSLITRNAKVSLSPAYDFLNTTLAMSVAKEEIALPLNGKKNNLRREDFIEYYGMQRLGLNTTLIQEILAQFKKILPAWQQLINSSFLSQAGKDSYHQIIENRFDILEI